MNDKFAKGEKIRVRHVTADAKEHWYDGEILDHVRDDVWRVTFGGFGLRFLMVEKDIQHATGETKDKGRKAGGGQADDARV